jgi:hypothetical protein
MSGMDGVAGGTERLILTSGFTKDLDGLQGDAESRFN